MDDIEDDDRYPSNIYGVSDRQGYGSSNRQKLPVRNVPISRPIRDQYDEDDDEDEEEGEEDEVEDLGEEEDDLNQNNDIRYVGKGMGDLDDYNDDDDDDDDDLLDDEEDDDNVDLGRHQKKRKLKSLLSSYEFAPRVTTPAVPAPSVLKPSYGGRNSLTGWTEYETFVLLDAWGDRFLQCGRKSLRTEEWQEVAEKVSEISKNERTETQCRNRLDTLKKKYKKEKPMLAETGATTSKWVYFKKMDMLMPTPPQQGQLSCGFDSGEYAFMNPRVYLNRANGLDEMRDSPASSESANDEEDVSDGLPPKKRNFGGEGSSVRVLADSIHKFSDIYEKVENSRKQQMLELETMRMDIHRELEMQKRQIMERARAEIVKMHQCQGDDDEANDVSADNASE